MERESCDRRNNHYKYSNNFYDFIISRLKNPTLLPFCVKAVQLTSRALLPEPNIFLSGTPVVDKIHFTLGL